MSLRPCKYGAECYQTNSAHKLAFSHPIQQRALRPFSTATTTNSLSRINGLEPAIILTNESVAHGKYFLKRIDEYYYCTCMAWRVGKAPREARTCKHLKEALGEDYENARLEWKNPLGVGNPPLASSTKAASKRHRSIADALTGSDDNENNVVDKALAKKRIKKGKKMPDAKVLVSDVSNSISDLITKRKLVNPARKEHTSTTVIDESENNQESSDQGEAEKFSAKHSAKRAETKLNAPKLLLAKSYEPKKHSVTGWWASEKLDGVRAFWNHETGELVSRLGNAFTPPDWFKDKLPKDLSLDGELFFGRGGFSETVSVVKTINSPHWSKITYQIFDIPSLANLPFEKRYEKLKTLDTRATPKILRVVPQTQIQSSPQIYSLLQEIESHGGEGIMLRKPQSIYIGARSDTLLKVKSFYDAEAVVVGYEKGKGKYSGMVGSLKCRMASGKEFKIGTGLSDAERSDPPALGAIVSYKFQELTKEGIPRFPSFIGIRLDANKPSDAVVR